MVSCGNKDPSFLSLVLSWSLGFRQERKAPVSFLLSLVHQCMTDQVAPVCPTSLLPRLLFNKGRHQFKMKLVVSFFSHKTEKGRNSWNLPVNTYTAHPSPALWWNEEASARWSRSSLSVVCLCTARGCELSCHTLQLSPSICMRLSHWKAKDGG